MLRKPSLESVVVFVISVAAFGLTGAALVLPTPETGQMTAAAMEVPAAGPPPRCCPVSARGTTAAAPSRPLPAGVQAHDGARPTTASAAAATVPVAPDRATSTLAPIPAPTAHPQVGATRMCQLGPLRPHPARRALG